MPQGLGQKRFLFIVWAVSLWVAIHPLKLAASSHDDSFEQIVRFDQSTLHNLAVSLLDQADRLAEEIQEGIETEQLTFHNGIYQCQPNATERFVENLTNYNNRLGPLAGARDLLKQISSLTNVREEDQIIWKNTMSRLIRLEMTLSAIEREEVEGDKDRFLVMKLIIQRDLLEMSQQPQPKPTQNNNAESLKKLKDHLYELNQLKNLPEHFKKSQEELIKDLKGKISQLESDDRTVSAAASADLNTPKQRNETRDNNGPQKNPDFVAPPNLNNPKGSADIVDLKLKDDLKEEIRRNNRRQTDITRLLKRTDLDIDLRSQYEDNLRQLEQNKKLLNNLSNNLKEPPLLNESEQFQKDPFFKPDNEFEEFSKNPFYDPNSPHRQSTMRFDEEPKPIDSGTKLSQNTTPTTPPKTDPLKTGPLATGSKPKPSDPVTVSEGTQSSQSRPRAQASTRISEITDPNEVYGDSSKTANNSHSNSVFSAKSNRIKDTQTSGETTNFENNSQQRQLSSVSNSDVANEQQDASNTLKMNLKGQPNRGSFFSPFTQTPFSSPSKPSLSEASKPDSGNSKDSAFSDAKKSQKLATESTLNPKREFDQEKESESTEEGFSLRKQPKRQKLSSRKNESGSGETVFSNTYVYQNNNYLNENKPISSKPEPTYIKNMDGTFSKAVAKTDKNTSEKQSNNTEKSDLDEQTSNIDSIEKISADIGSVNESKDIDLKATEEAKTSLWDILNKEPSLDTISQFLAQVSPIGGSEKNTDITEWMNWKDSKEKSLTTRKVNRSITSKNGETKNGFVSRFLGWLGLN